MWVDARRACRIEVEALRELLGELVQRWGGDGPDLKLLRADLDELASDPRLGSLASERRIDQLAMRLRRLCLIRAHEFADPHLRSPDLDVPKPLPGGASTAHSYERDLDTGVLEARIARATQVPEGWSASHVVVGSGMAAITNVLQSVFALVRPTLNRSVNALLWGSYFETTMVFELMRPGGLRTRHLTGMPELLAAIDDADDTDLLYLEPVRYDWDLSALDLPALLTAWRRRRGRRPRVVVIDTTLSSFTWPTRRALEGLRDGYPLTVIELRSGLKLDQQGLELANAGVVSVYSSHEQPSVPTAAQVGTYLRMIRPITGTAPAMDALALLECPFVFDPAWTRRHAGQVFLNNRMLAEALVDRVGGLFARVAHPALTASRPGQLAHAPFVVFHLAEDDLLNHGLLLAVIRAEQRRHGLSLTRGSSFGFRGHRYETVIPRLRERRGLFKVAMGARCGPSAGRTVELLRRLAGFPGFAELKRAYPDLQPVTLLPRDPGGPG